MEMRKFIVTLHADGSISWNEYIEARATCESAAFRRGYMTAVLCGREMACKIKKDAINDRDKNLMYAAVSSVLDAVSVHAGDFNA